MEDKIRVLLTEEEVNKKIKKIGEQVSKDYAGKSVHMICVLKGGVFFTCELAKRITVPVSLDFMSVSSYGSETKSSGIVKIIKDLDEPLEGKEVLIDPLRHLASERRGLLTADVALFRTGEVRQVAFDVHSARL